MFIKTRRMTIEAYTDSDLAGSVVNRKSTFLELTTENGRLSVNSSGEIALSISATDTALLTDGGVYDLEIIDTSSNVERVVEGFFIVDLEVTR